MTTTTLSLTAATGNEVSEVRITETMAELPAGIDHRHGRRMPGFHAGAATNHDGLRRVAVRGAGVTALSQAVAFAIQMIATVILARLLTPADFGYHDPRGTPALRADGLTAGTWWLEVSDPGGAATPFSLDVWGGAEPLVSP